jgi:3-dehydroquinate synthase
VATTIRVALSERSYDIEIDRGNLRHAAQFVAQRQPCSHAVVITDENVRPLFGESLARSLEAAGSRVTLLSVAAGEGSKCVSQSDRLWNELANSKTDRKSVVIALGGGVVGDLAGFIAATYARGLPFFQIPTTLLAQVDSSVGGKVGINLPAAKNMVGAFWQPTGVLIDLAALETLPEREYLSGLAEVVKYGVILDPPFFEYLESSISGLLARDAQVLGHVVARSCQLKAQVVEQDERELTGLRAVLNYGHTFCHAIETTTGYNSYLHGEAVAIGMVYASRLAELLGRIDAELTSRQVKLLRSLGLPTAAPNLETNALIEAMQQDKKVEHGRLRFVLPTRLGNVELIGGIAEQSVREAIESIHRDVKQPPLEI